MATLGNLLEVKTPSQGNPTTRGAGTPEERENHQGRQLSTIQFFLPDGWHVVGMSAIRREVS